MTSLFVLYKVPYPDRALAGAGHVPVRARRSGHGVVRSAILTPMVTSIIVVSIIWAMMYHSQNGLFRASCQPGGSKRMAFISDPRYALAAVSVMMIWKDIGFSFIILLAGLKGIPADLLRGCDRRWRQPLASVPAYHHPTAQAGADVCDRDPNDLLVPGLRAGLSDDQGRARWIRRRSSSTTSISRASTSRIWAMPARCRW